MSTMTLIDDYLDALLDDGTLLDGILLDGMAPDGRPHDSRPAAFEAPPMASAVEVLRFDVEAVAMPASAADPLPDPVLDSMPEPMPALPPAPIPAFVPAFVPAAPAPLAAPLPASSPAALQASPTPAMASSHRWLRVTVGNDSYALELLRVQEVVRLAPIVALRGAARAVLGVMNLRGRIVPVLDLGLWLDAGCVHSDERSRIVVVERDDEMIGVLVSAVEDVVTLGRERIEPPLASSDPGAIIGIARVGPAPTVLLDAGALFG